MLRTLPKSTCTHREPSEAGSSSWRRAKFASGFGSCYAANATEKHAYAPRTVRDMQFRRAHCFACRRNGAVTKKEYLAFLGQTS